MEEERSRRDILIHRNSSDATQSIQSSIQYRDLLSMNLDMFQSPAPIVDSVGSPQFSIPQWTPELASEALPAMPALPGAQSNENERLLERNGMETPPPPPEMESGLLSPPALSSPPFHAAHCDSHCDPHCDSHCDSLDLDLNAIPVEEEAPKTASVVFRYPDSPDATKSL